MSVSNKHNELEIDTKRLIYIILSWYFFWWLNAITNPEHAPSGSKNVPGESCCNSVYEYFSVGPVVQMVLTFLRTETQKGILCCLLQLLLLMKLHHSF